MGVTTPEVSSPKSGRHLGLLYDFLDDGARGQPAKPRLRFHHQPVRDDGNGELLDLFGRDELQAIKEAQGLGRLPQPTARSRAQTASQSGPSAPPATGTCPGTQLGFAWR